LEYFQLLFMRQLACTAVLVEQASHSGMIFLENVQYVHSETPEGSFCTRPAKMEFRCHSGGPPLAGFLREESMPITLQRRLPVGAERCPDGTHFRVWAPRRKRVEVVLDRFRTVELDRERDGYFSGFAEDVQPGMLYQFRFERNGPVFPDPASRFQPEG